MKKLLKFARLAIIAIAWASAAQPSFAQCTGPCASELTQLLNLARLVDQLATQGNILTTGTNQLHLATVNTTPFTSLSMSTNGGSLQSYNSTLSSGTSISFASPSLTSLFNQQNSTYTTYLSAPPAAATKQAQWSANTNSSVLTTLQAGQLQSAAMTGTEQSTLSGLKTQISSAQGNLQIAQANGSAILFTAQELQSLRQLLLTHTSLQAADIQRRSDEKAAERAAWTNFVKMPAVTAAGTGGQ
jgi:P-type conjugative transfer protein TrbJ